MFKFSQHLSVNNAFAVRGLKILAELASVLGEGARALQYSNQATELLGKMKQLMWNQTLPGFCDGVCTEVDGHSGEIIGCRIIRKRICSYNLVVSYRSHH